MTILSPHEISAGSGDTWPTSAQADLARRILPAYHQHGTGSYVANADVALGLWRVEDQVLPVVHRARGGDATTADVCSPWTHHVRYTLGEISRRRRGLSALARRAMIHMGMPVLRLSRIDDAVSVNNWLLATNPPVDLSRESLDALTARLIKEFPDRAILFRTINPDINPGLAERLRACGYVLVANRTVFLVDPASGESHRSENVRRDLRLLRDGRYDILAHEDLTVADMPRLAELHRLLYLQKHSAFNMQFTTRFFETAWRNRLFEFRAVRTGGRIDAYAAFFQLGGWLYWSLIGYDTSLPQALGLYRRAFSLLMEETRRRGLRSHLSAGAEGFKQMRGGRPSVEYDAVMFRHLPFRYHLGWRLLEAAGVFQHQKVRAAGFPAAFTPASWPVW